MPLSARRAAAGGGGGGGRGRGGGGARGGGAQGDKVYLWSLRERQPGWETPDCCEPRSLPTLTPQIRHPKPCCARPILQSGNRQRCSSTSACCRCIVPARGSNAFPYFAPTLELLEAKLLLSRLDLCLRSSGRRRSAACHAAPRLGCSTHGGAGSLSAGVPVRTQRGARADAATQQTHSVRAAVLPAAVHPFSTMHIWDLVPTIPEGSPNPPESAMKVDLGLAPLVGGLPACRRNEREGDAREGGKVGEDGRRRCSQAKGINKRRGYSGLSLTTCLPPGAVTAACPPARSSPTFCCCGCCCCSFCCSFCCCLGACFCPCFSCRGSVREPLQGGGGGGGGDRQVDQASAAVAAGARWLDCTVG